MKLSQYINETLFIKLVKKYLVSLGVSAPNKTNIELCYHFSKDYILTIDFTKSNKTFKIGTEEFTVPENRDNQLYLCARIWDLYANAMLEASESKIPNKDGMPRKLKDKQTDKIKVKKLNDKNEEVEESYSISEWRKSQIREFWKHDLNPITGHQRESTRNDSYHHTNFYLEKNYNRNGNTN